MSILQKFFEKTGYAMVEQRNNNKIGALATI